MVPELFLDTMHLVAEAPLERGFLALSTADDEHWFLPFHREAIKLLDVERMVRFGTEEKLPTVEWEESGEDDKRVVRVKCSLRGQMLEKSYPFRARKRDLTVAKNALDIRVWPNFVFLHHPKLPESNEDRVYYLRIRQEDSWRLDPLILARSYGPNGEPRGVDFFRPDNVSMGGAENKGRFRQARFYAFPAHGSNPISGGHSTAVCDPIGLYLEGKGLLLFRLESAIHPGGEPVPWRIGVDFGTSNTCITFRSLMEGVVSNPEAIQFDIQTTTMHGFPRYPEINPATPGEDNEGAAAVFDFPYRYEAQRLLTENVYFPTQFVTRLESAPESPNFRLAHGMIFPRNVVFENEDIRHLLQAHPPLLEQDTRVFRLVQDLKWENRAFRRAFLWHLYKIIVLHAARNGARVTEAAFSFPRAFSRDEVRHFTDEIRAIFHHHGQIRINPEDIISESAAVQHWLEGQTVSDDQLILDVGGGTTDYIAVLDERPAFQASYSLAAGCINEYFQTSGSLRRLLRSAVYEAVDKPKDSRAANRQHQHRLILDKLLMDVGELVPKELTKVRAFSQQAFFGLSSMIEDVHLSRVGELLRTPKKKPTKPSDSDTAHGFFLSLLLLYSGLIYQAARLMKQHDFVCTNLRLLLIGNGSRYCRLLGEERSVLKPLFQQIFQTAGPNPNIILKDPRIMFKGKTIVAEGLVMGSKNSHNAPVVPDKPSLDILMSRLTKPSERGTSTRSTHELSGLIQVLDDVLHAGRINGVLVVPYCDQTLQEELEPLLTETRRRARTREKENSLRLEEGLRRAEEAERLTIPDEAAAWRESAYAVEPVFITRLRCLLELIREKFPG